MSIPGEKHNPMESTPPAYTGGYSSPPQAGYPDPQGGYVGPQGGYAVPGSGYPNISTTGASGGATVIVQQPQSGVIPGSGLGRPWGSGMCSICDDMKICMCGFWCCPCLAIQVSTDMGENCCVPLCVPGALTALRVKIRTHEGIEGSVFNDCCIECFCNSCGWCQLARELKHVNNRRLNTVPMQTTIIRQ